MKFCDECGRQLEDGAQFCDRCGRSQAAVATEPQSPPVAVESASTDKIPFAWNLPELPVVWKAVILFVVAICARILFLEWVGMDYVGWYADSYHHWQIAFYTLHIGLAQNPPRMWDLSGQEYFWGLLPTLTESLLLYIFNSTSLVPFRLFNSVTGSISVVLIYLLGRRFFDDRMGLLAGVTSALSPVLWEVDTSGMLDPMGITLLLLGLLLYKKRNYLTGLVLGLASLVHIEYWFLSLAVIAFYLVYERSGIEFLPAIFGWLTPMAPYFYVMQIQTGDALYALHYNLVSSVVGEWITGLSVPMVYQILPRAAFLLIFAACVICVIWMIRRIPPSYPFHSFFLARVSMQGIIFGMTAYVVPYIAFGQIPRVLIDRLFAIDYYYIPFVVALVATWLIRRRHFHFEVPEPHLGSEIRVKSGAIMVILLLFNGALFPLVISQYYTTYGSYENQLEMADFIASHYHGGTIINSLVTVNYRLINDGIPLQNVFGTLYCPAAGGRDAYAWLVLHNVTWVIPDSNLQVCFPSLLQSNTAPFHLAYGTFVYTVNQQELARLAGP